jgi:hypothetical protein
MGVPMTPAVVLIVCKVLAPITDDNSQFTHWEHAPWAYENSMMVCRREVITIMDANEDPEHPKPLSKQLCMASAIRLATEWDLSHRGGKYRVWRVACPTPTVDTRSGEIVGWVLPDCGHHDTVVCEKDSVI